MSEDFFKLRGLYSCERSVIKRPYETIFGKCSENIYLFIKVQISKRHEKLAACLHVLFTLPRPARYRRLVQRGQKQM